MTPTEDKDCCGQEPNGNRKTLKMFTVLQIQDQIIVVDGVGKHLICQLRQRGQGLRVVLRNGVHKEGNNHGF